MNIYIDSQGIIRGTKEPVPKDEICYFIEQGSPDGGTGEWLHRHGYGTTRYPHFAMKFAKRHEAEIIRRSALLDQYFVSEHILMVSELALQRWKDSTIPFDDQRAEALIFALPSSAWSSGLTHVEFGQLRGSYGSLPKLIPDTILDVALPEFIPVWQYQTTEGFWVDDNSESYQEGNYTIKYRRILRFK